MWTSSRLTNDAIRTESGLDVPEPDIVEQVVRPISSAGLLWILLHAWHGLCTR